MEKNTTTQPRKRKNSSQTGNTLKYTLTISSFNCQYGQIGFQIAWSSLLSRKYIEPNCVGAYIINYQHKPSSSTCYTIVTIVHNFVVVVVMVASNTDRTNSTHFWWNDIDVLKINAAVAVVCFWTRPVINFEENSRAMRYASPWFCKICW